MYSPGEERQEKPTTLRLPDRHQEEPRHHCRHDPKKKHPHGLCRPAQKHKADACGKADAAELQVLCKFSLGIFEWLGYLLPGRFGPRQLNLRLAHFRIILGVIRGSQGRLKDGFCLRNRRVRLPHLH